MNWFRRQRLKEAFDLEHTTLGKHGLTHIQADKVFVKSLKYKALSKPKMRAFSQCILRHME